MVLPKVNERLGRRKITSARRTTARAIRANKISTINCTEVATLCTKSSLSQLKSNYHQNLLELKAAHNTGEKPPHELLSDRCGPRCRPLTVSITAGVRFYICIDIRCRTATIGSIAASGWAVRNRQRRDEFYVCRIEGLLRAVKPISRSQWSDGYGADSGPSRGEPCRRALRPIEASKAAICNGRFTSTPAVRSA